MGRLSIDQFKNAVSGKGINDVVNYLKNAPGYDAYKRQLANGRKDSWKALQIIGMLYQTKDPEFSAISLTVAMDIMYSLADQKLRAEILQNKEEK